MNHMAVEQDRGNGGYGVDPAKKAGHNRENEAVKRRSAKVQGSAGAYAADFFGSSTEETVCGGRGKTAAELMQEASQTNVDVQRDYLVVLSASMSTEDFARLQEEGMPPTGADLETVVTIIDEIKASLARSGQQITGYTDDLDAETLKKITGSEGLANEIVRKFHENDIPVTEENVKQALEARERAADLKPLDDRAKKYLIANHMVPSIENIYRAQHCTSAETDRADGRSGVPAAETGRADGRFGASAAETGRADGRSGVPVAETGRSRGSGGYYQDESGYYAKRAENFDWEKLSPQMEKVIESAGLAVTKDTLSAARWLVESGMPLNGENLYSLCTLDKLTKEETVGRVIAAAAAAVSDGKSGREANLADTESRVEKAARYVETFAALQEEAVDIAAGKNGVLTLRTLSAAQTSLTEGDTALKYAADRDGRLLLEQVRLKMSVEANLRLLRKGIQIDTAELSRLVEELDQAAKERESLLFGEETVTQGGTAGGVQSFDAGRRSDCYEDTLKKAAELPGLPVAVIGRFSRYRNGVAYVDGADSAVGAFTLNGIYEEGKALAAAYTKAGESYETLMTAPRADLGDSIRKAFRNVDALLEELDLPATEANRRAVRILGYNRMEVKKENMDAVKSTDLTVRRVAEKMTPGTVMHMIREGIDPLSMNMEELEAYLDGQQQEPEQDYNHYAKYLYTLDKNGSVTEEERESYIGIYRLFRQLKKTDGAAIGALVEQGAEPTVSNLLSAVRSGKRRGMDYTVDDRFGGVEVSGGTTGDRLQGDGKGNVHRAAKSISDQIESAFSAADSIVYEKKLAADILDHLDKSPEIPELFRQLSRGDGLLEGLSLEELSQTLREATGESETDRERIRQQAAEMRDMTGKTEEAVLKELLSFDRPVTLDRLAAGGQLFKNRGKLPGRMKELSQDTGKETELAQSVEKLWEDIGEEASAKEAYKELTQTYTDILEEAVYGEVAQAAGGRIDLKEIRSLCKQISLTADLAGEESYEVPVEIDGEMTSIHLRILRGEQEGGRLSVSMETKGLGKVAAKLQLSAQTEGAYRLTGYFVCDREVTRRLLQDTDGLKKVLEPSDIKFDSLPVILEEELSFDRPEPSETGEKKKAPEDPDGPERVSTQKLYRTAKALIGYIRKGEGLQDENML